MVGGGSWREKGEERERERGVSSPMFFLFLEGSFGFSSDGEEGGRKGGGGGGNWR